jgi:hypothetical protein
LLAGFCKPNQENVENNVFLICKTGNTQCEREKRRDSVREPFSFQIAYKMMLSMIKIPPKKSSVCKVKNQEEKGFSATFQFSPWNVEFSILFSSHSLRKKFFPISVSPE